jgi:hypothetical protein
MDIYTATVEREGKFWVTRVQGLPVKGSAVTQGRTWGEAHEMAVDLVANLLDVPATSFLVRMEFADPELAAVVAEAERTRDSARLAVEEAEKALVTAVRKLTAQTTVRDAGGILGYSHQYIAKLAPKKE